MHASIGDSDGASFERSSAGRSSMSPRRRSHFDMRFATRVATTSTSLVDGARPSWNAAALSRVSNLVYARTMVVRPDDDLQLLLVHADDQREVLDGGLPADTTATRAPLRQLGDRLAYPEGDLNALHQQRWGVVAPDGPAGDRLLEIVAPLREARREQQGGDAVRVYRVPPRMSVDDALAWRSRVYDDEDLDESDRPLSLLVLGDADAVSFELQQAMASRSLVGRLAFADERGYEAYVHKVLAAERMPPPSARARVLFYTVRDGTKATAIGEQALVRPTIARAERRKATGDFPAREIVRIEGEGDALLAEVASRDPAMLFTLSHGIGPPRRGWKSAAAREAMQGAMSLGMGDRLTAADVASRPFLPGGIWFFFACYSAGTPSESGYEDWLQILQTEGRYSGRVEAVLQGLPREGERPFVAALPQAALANPEGPLAVIGHVDQAWTYGFRDEGAYLLNRASRFQGVFRSLVDGSRAAVGHRALMRWYSDAAEQIAMIQGRDERARARGKGVEVSGDEAVRRAHLWMLAKDLSGYVLLGDPAVRLPIAARAIEEGRRGAAAAPADMSAMMGFVSTAKRGALAPEVMAEAVREVIAGKEDRRAIAERLGVKRSELDRWVRVYEKAGLEALAKIG